MRTITKGNPFTHREKTRTSIAGHEVYGGCDWCGQTPRTLFHYGSQIPRDANSVGFGNLSPRWFCNKECARSFGLEV